MVGKKSGRALLRDEGLSLCSSGNCSMLIFIGLQRTDNQMGLTSWPQIPPINQKNYYTYGPLPLPVVFTGKSEVILTLLCSDYLKRDDQILAFRLQQDEARNRMTKKAKDRDRALAMGDPPPTDADGDQEMADEEDQEDGESGGQEPPGSKVVVIHMGSQNLRIGLSSDALPKTVPMAIAKKASQNESEEGDAEPTPKRVKLDDGTWPEPEKQFGPTVSILFTQGSYT